MRGRGLLALVLIGSIIWLVSGFYTVGPNEVGLNMIFGRYTGKTAPGLRYNLPFPIGSVQKLAVTDRNTLNIGFTFRQDLRGSGSQTQLDVPEESLILTGDNNIADVKFVVIWQIDPVQPEDYAFNVANQRETVKAVAESAMREVIGRHDIMPIFTTERPALVAGAGAASCRGGDLVYSARFGCFNLAPAAGTPTIGRNFGVGPGMVNLANGVVRITLVRGRGDDREDRGLFID